MSRGTDRRTIFDTDRECRHFEELLPEFVERFRLRLHAYVLMYNHSIGGDTSSECKSGNAVAEHQL